MTAPKNQNRLAAASALAANKISILKVWEELCRSKVEAAKTQTRLALRDSMPEFLDSLVATLSCEEPLHAAQEQSEVAREHGYERASQQNYDLEQVIYEYHLLRKVLTDTLSEHGDFDAETTEVLQSYVEHGIRKAAVTYASVEARFQESQKTELHESRRDAERLNLAKSAFLANMSHEIRTPLGAIMGFVSLLGDADTTSLETSEHLKIIDRHTHHLLRIVDDILDLTKVESGRMSAELSEFSLVQFLAEFSSFAALKAREHGLSFEFTAESLIPDLIVSDPSKLRQILSNSVGNAVKFTERGKVKLTVSYDDNQLTFKISDTGRGISAEQRSHLFQAFAQVDSSTTRKFGGTGLGLILTKKLSEVLGGDYNLRSSEPGKGSTFVASLPISLPEVSELVPVDALAARISEKPLADSVPDISDMKVLLVEDSPDNQVLVKLMLSKVGIDLEIVGDGASGVKSALNEHFDIVLMDIQMPIMDGHEAAKALRAQGYTRPIIALTAHAMKEERDRAEASGFSHFLTKPINRKNLIDLLHVLYVTMTANHHR